MIRAALFGAVLVALTAPGRASPAPTVVVAAEREDDSIARRARAELRAIGFDAQFEQRRASDASPLFEAVAEHWTARAVLAVSTTKCVEVWVHEDAGPPFRERLCAGPAESAELLAVRAVEAIRAATLRVAMPREPAPRAPPPVRVEPAPASPGPSSRPTRAHPFAGASASVIGSPAGLVPGLNLGAQIGLRMERKLELMLRASTPVARGMLQGPEGSARAGPTILAAGVAVPVFAALPLTISAEGGIGALMLRSTGVDAARAYESRTAEAWAVLPYLCPRFRYEISRSWSASAGALVGVTSPRFEVRLGGRTVATWGRPVLAVDVGAELAWGE